MDDRPNNKGISNMRLIAALDCLTMAQRGQCALRHRWLQPRSHCLPAWAECSGGGIAPAGVLNKPTEGLGEP
ncbi:hypothetical protein FHW92_002498 [Novosphingobium sp. SG707]|nr:hypothetical protein [Novosphingobium sp. SG707]